VTSSGDQASPTATPSSEGSASGGAAQSPVNFRRDVLDILHLAEQTGADSGLQRAELAAVACGGRAVAGTLGEQHGHGRLARMPVEAHTR